jgi:hypothetical protein
MFKYELVFAGLRLGGCHRGCRYHSLSVTSQMGCIDGGIIGTVAANGVGSVDTGAGVHGRVTVGPRIGGFVGHDGHPCLIADAASRS